jgi:hypothetical protein
MSRNSFVTNGIWKSISSAAKRSDAPVYASVAYFGKGASKLLPLPTNSRLVVDASIGAVKNGQTCPADLKAMQKRGVRIYSIPNLHAKVYVFGGTAFIGSANASNHSAGTLIEAVIQTADKGIMRSAREFVRGLCLDELGPERLDYLAKLYRPPRFANGAKRSSKKHGIRPELPRLLLAQLENESPPSETKATVRDGLESAKKKRKHGRNYTFDYFWWRGTFPYKVGDKVIQVTEENSRLSLVAPPADIFIWPNGDTGLVRLHLLIMSTRRCDGCASKSWRAAWGMVRRRGFSATVWYAIRNLPRSYSPLLVGSRS